MHLAVIGTGRVGRFTIMELLSESWIDKLTLVDTKPGLAKAVAKESQHALASIRNDIAVEYSEQDSGFANADIILVAAGTPRDSDTDSRRDLSEGNAEIIRKIARETFPKNQEACYVIVTNPVDAMATLFSRITQHDWVISTGTNLESQRFRASIAEELDMPIPKISGYVAGEHGSEAVLLWSTVTVKGQPIHEYLEENEKDLDKEIIENRVKTVSKMIIDNSGGTRHGPATSFRDILRSIALDEHKVLSIATDYELQDETSKLVKVGWPQAVSSYLEPSSKLTLQESEKEKIEHSAREIYKTYSELN